MNRDLSPQISDILLTKIMCLRSLDQLHPEATTEHIFLRIRRSIWSVALVEAIEWIIERTGQ